MAVEQVTYKNIDRGTRNMIMAGLAIAMLASCFDSTIVGTIGFEIAKDLGGMGPYAWMATAYLLCETVMIPVAGKLSDVYGRKTLFLIGLAIFTGGSIIAGLSVSMEMFIVCRAIQGFGGGILIPEAMAAVADLFAPSDRGKVQGLFGAVFGIGSGIGPLIGGYIEGAASWHWCFYINLPLALVAFLLTIKKFPTPVDDGVKHIDFKGIAMLSVLLLDFILLIQMGGKEFEWVSSTTAIMIAIAVAALAIFIRVERKAVDPILAPHLMQNKTVVRGSIYMFIFGIGMMGALIYTNLLVVGVFGLTTLEAGMWSLSMILAMSITSFSSGALLRKTGFRPWLLVGPMLCFIGLFCLSGMAVDQSMFQMGMGPDGPGLDAGAVRDAYMYRYLGGIFVLGLGLGCMMAVVMAAVQNSSRPSEMGMTTSAVNLFRSIGFTMGTAIFAMLINSRLGTELLEAVPEIYDLIPHTTDVLNGGVMSQFPMQIPGILTAFSNSVDFAFLAGGVIMLLLVLVGIFFKGGMPPEEECETSEQTAADDRS